MRRLWRRSWIRRICRSWLFGGDRLSRVHDKTFWSTHTAGLMVAVAKREEFRPEWERRLRQWDRIRRLELRWEGLRSVIGG